ncbi:MAG: putative sugar nucleotidyl transferase, partial [Ignavibacteriaceae bacterium]
MHICIFEDNNCLDFEPLIYSRPVYDLICGTFTLKEKLLLSFGNPDYSLHCRNYLQNITKRNNPGKKVNQLPEEDCLFVNGRVIGDNNLKSTFNSINKKKKIFTSNNQLAAVFVPQSDMNSLINLQNDLFDLSFFKDYEKNEVKVQMVNYIWDIININGEEIKKDFELRISSHNGLNYLNEVSDT